MLRSCQFTDIAAWHASWGVPAEVCFVHLVRGALCLASVAAECLHWHSVARADRSPRNEATSGWTAAGKRSSPAWPAQIPSSASFLRDQATALFAPQGEGAATQFPPKQVWEAIAIPSIQWARTWPRTWPTSFTPPLQLGYTRCSKAPSPTALLTCRLPHAVRSCA